MKPRELLHSWKLPIGRAVIYSLACVFVYVVAGFAGMRFGLSPQLVDAVQTLAIVTLPSLLLTIAERERTKELIVEQTTESVKQLLEQLMPGRLKGGISAFHPRMDWRGLFSALEPGDELLGLDTYLRVLPEPEIKKILRGALNRGVKVRMLAINPTCANARYRAEELSSFYEGNPKSFLEEARRYIRFLGQLHLDHPEQLAYHVYQDLPSAPFYLILREGQVLRGYSSYFLVVPTQSSGYFEWRPVEDGMLNSMHEYFETKWFRWSATGSGSVANNDGITTPASRVRLFVQPESRPAADVSR